MTEQDRANKSTTIAVFTDRTCQWEYFTFPSQTEAREAVNKAREDGKAAVFYSGETLSEPPSYIDSSSEVSCD